MNSGRKVTQRFVECDELFHQLLSQFEDLLRAIDDAVERSVFGQKGKPQHAMGVGYQNGVWRSGRKAEREVKRAIEEEERVKSGRTERRRAL